MSKNFLKISAKKFQSPIFLKILLTLHFFSEHAINLNYKTQNYKLPKEKNKLPNLSNLRKLSNLSRVTLISNLRTLANL